MRGFATVAALTALVFGAGTAVAGSADINFAAPDGYSDPGAKGGLREQPTREVVMREIRAHLSDLAQRGLGPNQTLKVDIVDIDIAGRRDTLRMGADDVRVYDDISPPRIKLRFVLEENGRAVTSGEESVSDPSYLNGVGRSQASSSDPIRYERAMLTKWFEARFVRREPVSR